MKYYNRNSAITQLQVLEILDSKLQISNEQGQVVDSFYYDEIVKVNLLYSPTRINWRNHQTTVFCKNGKKLIFRNYRYKGLANFEEQTEVYEQFVNLLFSKLSHSSVKFITGFKKPNYILYIIFMIVMALFMSALTVIMFLQRDNTANAVISIFASLLIWYLAFKVSIIYKPGKYNPKEQFKIN